MFNVIYMFHYILMLNIIRKEKKEKNKQKKKIKSDLGGFGRTGTIGCCYF